MLVGHEDRRLDPRLFHEGDPDRIGHVGRIVHLHHRAVGHVDAIDHRRRGRDEVDAELAVQPLADDLEMEQAQEAAAEAEAESGRRLGLEGEARIVQMQFAQRLAQLLELGGIHREEAAEHHLLRRLEAGQRRVRAVAFVGDGVANLGVGNLLDRGGHEPDFSGAQDFNRLLLGREHADAIHLVGRVRGHQPDALAFFQLAVDNADEDDDAEIEVVPGIDQQRLQRRIRLALGRGQPGDDAFEHRLDIQPRLGGNRDRLGGVDADHVLDLLAYALGLGGGQVDLVEHRDDVEPGIDRLIDIGQGLGFHALARVDHQQRALAGGKAARNLIAEIDVPGRVHQVEDIGRAVLGRVVQADGLGLDGDAALALDIHRVQDLLLHLALGQPAGDLDQPVGQGRFPVVDMGHDGKIADMGEVGHRGDA